MWRTALTTSTIALSLLVFAGPASAAGFTVNSTADAVDAVPGNGACATGTGACTLRAAIQETSALTSNDTINLPAGVYQLTGAAGDDVGLSGDLDITAGAPTETLTIAGASARTTRIVGTGADRVIDVVDANTVAITGVTITGGGGVNSGGGVLATGAFSLTDSTVTGNRADDPNGTSNQGGGIFNSNQMNLSRVTVSGNVATRGVNSTFGPQGGGIFDNGVPTSTLANVTISGNQATGAGAQGGGMFYNANANSTTLRHVTIAGNSVPAGETAGGLFLNDEIAIVNSLIALNRAGGAVSNCTPDPASTHSGGGNLQEGSDCSFGPADRQSADPKLGPLQNNGGNTDTQALLVGSPAIDAAAAASCLPTDQIGTPRPQFAGCDIGAFELAPAAQPSGLPAPVLGKTVNVVPVKGKVFVSLPPGAAARASATVPGLKGRTFVPLTQARRVPVGSLLDTRRGTVRLTTATSKAGVTQSGEFTSGVFQVLQSRSSKAKGLADLRLKGSSFKNCKRIGKKASASARSKRKVRRLRGNAKGRFSTRGRYSAATVRGTDWTVTDRCDGTLTQVKRGKVTVRDFRRKKNITVKTGKKYLAKAPR